MYSIATYRISSENKAEDLSSKVFFTQNSEEDLFKDRHAIQRGERHFYCGFCGKPLKICGGGKGENKQQLHFRHKFKHDAECCGYNENETSLSKRQIELKKFANEEEGKLHRQLKFLIADTLENSGAETKIERYIVDEQDYHDRRRPDIRAIFLNKDIAIEVQITSTFMSVIVGREDFYASHNMFLLWVINEFRPYLFHQKDIIYSNKNQAFVLDEEARMRTAEEGILYLTCYYKSYYCDPQGDIVESSTYQHELITFDDLIFDEKDYSVYYFDADKNKKQCEKEQKQILKRLHEEQERKMREQEAIRIKQELEEKERQRQRQIEYNQYLEEQKRLQKEEEERRQKEEAERKERERLNLIERTQKGKIEDYVYHDALSLEDYWLYYQQINEEERQYADEKIHDIIIEHVCRYDYYSYSVGKNYNDKNAENLYIFLKEHNYSFNWEKFEKIPDWYLNRSNNFISKSILYLYQSIIFNLYVNHNYHLPNSEEYLNEIENDFQMIIRESQAYEENPYHAKSFDDITMILLCYERIRIRSFPNEKEIFKLVYNKKDVIRHLYSIYLGELVGEDFIKDRYYYSFFIKLVSPYYHLYKRMMECRSRLFPDRGLVQNLLISKKEIEDKIKYSGITPNYEMDALMPILFPDIPWELQQYLFE